MKNKPKYPVPLIVRIDFEYIHIAHSDEVIEFVKKYDVEGPNPFLVTGGLMPYEVDFLRQSCTCPHARFRHEICKHMRSLNFLLVYKLL